jgi:hypothetical protein
MDRTTSSPRSIELAHERIPSVMMVSPKGEHIMEIVEINIAEIRKMALFGKKSISAINRIQELRRAIDHLLRLIAIIRICKTDDVDEPEDIPTFIAHTAKIKELLQKYEEAFTLQKKKMLSNLFDRQLKKYHSAVLPPRAATKKRHMLKPKLSPLGTKSHFAIDEEKDVLSEAFVNISMRINIWADNCLDTVRHFYLTEEKPFVCRPKRSLSVHIPEVSDELGPWGDTGEDEVEFAKEDVVRRPRATSMQVFDCKI